MTHKTRMMGYMPITARHPVGIDGMKLAFSNIFILITVSLTGFCDEPKTATNVASSGTHAGEEFAHQVGLKRANPWGFHDLHGNTFEWCLDAYAPALPGGRDPLQQDR